MDLDLKLTKIGLKMKQLVLVDLSFPKPMFAEFKSAYDVRYVHLPARRESVSAYASGLAMMGKQVLIYGLHKPLEIVDPMLHIKQLMPSPEATWSDFEEKLKEFGPGVVEIPA